MQRLLPQPVTAEPAGPFPRLTGAWTDQELPEAPVTTLLDAPPDDRLPSPPAPSRRPVVLGVVAVLVLVLLGAAALSRGGGTPSGSYVQPAAGLAEPEPGQAPDPAVPGKGAESLGRVVRSGSVSLVAPDGGTSALLDAVQRAAVDAGGQVFSTSTQESAERPSGTVVVRVPAARFEALVLAVRGLATVVSASSTGRDVTAETADLEAQVRSLQAARERFLAILGRAGTVAEVLSVQQQVDDVTARIDSATAQARVLRDSSDFSTLTVDVAQEGDPYLDDRADRGGLGAALRDARDGFVRGLAALVRLSGPALLLALCLGAVLGLARLVQRLRTRSP